HASALRALPDLARSLRIAAALGRGPPPPAAAHDRSHVANLAHHAVSHHDGDIGEGLWIDDAPGPAHELLHPATLDATGRYLLVLTLQRLHHLHGTHVVGVHRARIELHANLTPITTDDVHAADAGNRLQPRRDDLVSQVRELAQSALAALQRDRHDRRVVRIEVLNDRVFDIRREGAANARHLRLHILLGDADVDTEVER